MWEGKKSEIYILVFAAVLETPQAAAVFLGWSRRHLRELVRLEGVARRQRIWDWRECFELCLRRRLKC